MPKHKKIISLLLAVCLLLSLLPANLVTANAADIYSLYSLKNNQRQLTLYTNQPDSSFHISVGHSALPDYTQKQYDKAYNTICNDLVWTTSDASVVQFITSTRYEADGTVTYGTTKKLTKSSNVLLTHLHLLGLKEGTATLTLKSKKLKTTIKVKVTVKNAELKADNEVFYTGNNYTFSMYGNTSAVSFSSSNPKVAAIDSASGVMKIKKTGSTTISCVGDDGQTYKYKVKVQKSGLSYTKLTTYYYTGFREGCYTYFPLVAKGIDVKSWKSSNSKVCKVNKLGNIGQLQMMGTGTCTITCTAQNNKTYKCKLTVVGGKKWGGLKNGYCPTLSQIKKHGYFKDINTLKDYGKTIVTIFEYDHEVSLGNGNKPMDFAKAEEAHQILAERYPGAEIKTVSGLGDYLVFTNDSKTKSGRIWVSCYYVE